MGKREPGYCHHKPSGQAYIRLDCKPIYLGVYGTSESRDKYNRIKAEWLVNRQSAAVKHSKGARGATVAELSLPYLDYAAEFGVLEFRAVRDWWLKSGDRCRQYINRQMKRTIRIVKWGVGEAMVPPSVHEAIKCVAPLREGKTTAKEAEPVLPVDTDTDFDGEAPSSVPICFECGRYCSIETTNGLWRCAGCTMKETERRRKVRQQMARIHRRHTNSNKGS